MKYLILPFVFASITAAAAPQTDVVCRSVKVSSQGSFNLKIATVAPRGGHPDMFITYGFSTWLQPITDQVWVRSVGSSLIYESENFPGGNNFRLEVKLASSRIPGTGYGKFYLNDQKPIEVSCRVFHN